MALSRLRITGLAVLVLVGGACRRDLSSPAASIVLISLDTVRADHLSLYGFPRTTTPYLSELSERCVTFERAIAQSGSTFPSHRSILTSRYSWHVGESDVRLAEALQAAGYATAGFTGGGNVAAELGFSRGFDSWSEAKSGHRTLDAVLPALRQWLAARVRERPSFVFLHTYDPHHPYDPPAPYDSLFMPEYSGSITGPATGELLAKAARVPPFADFTGEVPLSAADRSKIVALYDGQLRYVDDRLREVFTLLKDSGLLDRSVVVLTSDHGEEFWEHGGVLHSHTIHQELIHVPMLICLPQDRLGGTRVSQVVRQIDIGPTVMDLVGVDRPNSFSGHSLRGFLEGREAALDLPGIAELNWFKAIVRPPWKLIVDQKQKRLQLFDIEQDPFEQKDLFDGRADVAVRLYRELAKELGAGMNEQVGALPDGGALDAELRAQLKALGYLQ